MKVQTRRRHCDVCGSTSARLLSQYTVTEWPVVECEGCGFVFLHEVPEYEALSEELAWEKTKTAESERRKAQRWSKLDQWTRFRLKLGKFVDDARRRRVAGNGGNVLEIGCGGSTRIPDGCIPHGIEISKGLAQRARPKYEARGGSLIHAPAIEGIEHYPDEFFDSIIMRSYLEHEAQPRLILERSFVKLKKGGRIYIRVPNFGSINRRVQGAKWCGFRFPDHVNYFTPSSLRRLTESLGFKFKWVNRFSVFDDNVIAELLKPEQRG